MRNWLKVILASGMLAVVVTGCGAIDREVDCNKICNKKRDCVNNNYNVSACVDYCRSEAKTNDSYAQKVNDCSACVETRACIQSAECYLKNDCPTLP